MTKCSFLSAKLFCHFCFLLCCITGLRKLASKHTLVKINALWILHDQVYAYVWLGAPLKSADDELVENNSFADLQRGEGWQHGEADTEGLNEQAQRQQLPITGPSAVSYQHLFEGASVRQQRAQCAYSSPVQGYESCWNVNVSMFSFVKIHKPLLHYLHVMSLQHYLIISCKMSW